MVADFKRWYLEHKAEVNERRRKKYRTDPLWRSIVKERARRRYKSGSEERVAERQKRFNAKLQSPKEYHLSQCRIVVLDGKPAEVYSTGVLAHRLGCPTNWVREAWLKGGVLPPPTFVDARGRNWFSKEYIEKLLVLYRNHRAKHPKLKYFGRVVARYWNVEHEYDPRCPASDRDGGRS